MEPINAKEVKKAVFEMNPSKSPGLDGMNGFFYQHFWEIIGEKITGMVAGFFRTGRLDPEMNRTNICLIPKNIRAKRLLEIRSISLGKVAYRIIANVLTNRIKEVLPSIISKTQAAFVNGRLISDNILTAHEMLHCLKTKNKCSEEFIAVKTDISKAFDRVEWSFLDLLLRVLGFPEEWRKLVLTCVSTVSYQVLINGNPHGSIKPSRGIR